ncbi:MAG: hypothetical protein V3V00_15900 [Saprospiraceae bacterium]
MKIKEILNSTPGAIGSVMVVFTIIWMTYRISGFVHDDFHKDMHIQAMNLIKGECNYSAGCNEKAMEEDFFYCKNHMAKCMYVGCNNYAKYRMNKQGFSWIGCETCAKKEIP